MLTSGDVVNLDLGTPQGREVGFVHPAVIITAQRILDAGPSVVQIVPLTSTIRPFHSELKIDADGFNGLTATSAAQCQHVRSVSSGRVLGVRGNVGAQVLTQLRDLVAVIIDARP